MSPELLVSLNGERLGVVSRLSGGRLRLAYDADYSGTPLSVSMPVSTQEYQDRLIRPWLDGLLPDNTAVVDRWSRTFRVAPSAFAILGTPIGEDCAGAVQFRPRGSDSRPAEGDGVTWLDEVGVAQILRGLRADQTSWLGGDDLSGRFSLSGAQPKTALYFDGSQWGVPAGSVPTTHILKPAHDDLSGHELNEHLCLTAARRLGIPAARTQVVLFEDQEAIAIERFDRIVSDGCVTRLHQEDLCQALSVPPTRKYESDGGPSARDALGLFRRAMTPQRRVAAQAAFIDALIFNWLIAGTDAHAKNYSLLLLDDDVALAPLYDVASALPYGWHERKLRTAMKIGRDYSAWPGADPWPRFARSAAQDEAEIHARVRALGDAVADAFSDARKVGPPSPKGAARGARLVDLVADRATRCLAVIPPSTA